MAAPRPAAPPAPPVEGDPDHEMRGNSLEAQARRRERARCASIVTSADGIKHPALACVLAFQTRVPVAEAVRVLSDVQQLEFGHLAVVPESRSPWTFDGGVRVH